jgi:hypothetical protein
LHGQTRQAEQAHAELVSAIVSDHRGSNSQVVDFERVEICPVFMVKIEDPEKSNT